MVAAVESMFSYKTTPWHGLGKILTDYPSKTEINSLAGLDWNVDLLPTYTNIVSSDGSFLSHKLQTQAVRRVSDNSIIGEVGAGYTPLQNSEVVDWFAPFLDSGQVKIVTAGSLFSGRKVWWLGEIQVDPLEVVKGDALRAFLLFSHAHDGTSSCRVSFTPIRVVCANTLAMAGRKHTGQIRVKHTTNIKVNLDNIRETIDLATRSFQANTEQYALLAKRGINQNDIRKYVKLCLDIKQEDKDLSTRSKNIIDTCIKCIAKSPGVELAPDTWWSAYNGINFYLNYVYGRSQENRLDGLWFGKGAQMNSSALETALSLSA